MGAGARPNERTLFAKLIRFPELKSHRNEVQLTSSRLAEGGIRRVVLREGHVSQDGFCDAQERRNAYASSVGRAELAGTQERGRRVLEVLPQESNQRVLKAGASAKESC